MKHTKRDASLDVIRILATFFVMSVHFFSQIGYYEQVMAGKRMLVMTILRSFFMICVPLFLLLTGYLMSGKRLSKRYYLGIVKTLSIYLIASILHIVYKNSITPGTYTLKSGILGILRYSAANYAWYVEMYIGLFLIIPFLNLAYTGLKGQKQKLVLVFSFVAVTSITLSIAPRWWSNAYPLTYYFIGCYLKEFGIPLKRKTCLLLLPFCAVFTGFFVFYKCQGGLFRWEIWQSYSSIFSVGMAVLFFSFFAQSGKINGISHRAKGILRYLSELTFGAYLVSYIFDSTFYPKLLADAPDTIYNLKYYFILVPLVFLCAMLLSAGMNLLYQAASWAVKRGAFLVKKKSAV